MTDAERLLRLRRKMFLTAYPLKTAHLASAFSVTELMYALYVKQLLRYRAEEPDWPERDRFILSKGHASLALYAMLNDVGMLDSERLSTFCRPGNSIGGEINPLEAPGIEAATGSLGHGLSFGVGQALALKLDKLPSHVWVLVGNGELDEGSIWEAAMSAYKFQLDNLTVILDDNRLQKMGFTADIMGIEDWSNKWRAFGWKVDNITDGHDLDEVIAILSQPNLPHTPRVIIAHTTKGKGVSLMENDATWHFRMPKKRELKVFMNELNITEDELQACRERI